MKKYITLVLIIIVAGILVYYSTKQNANQKEVIIKVKASGSTMNQSSIKNDHAGLIV